MANMRCTFRNCVGLALICCSVAIAHGLAASANHESAAGAGRTPQLKCTLVRTPAFPDRGSGHLQTEDRLEVVGMRAVNVVAMTFGVREQDIVRHNAPLTSSIDVVIEGVRGQAAQLEVLRGVLAPALDVTIETGSASVPGYVLSRADGTGGPVNAVKEGQAQSCRVTMGKLEAVRASGTRIAVALNAAGSAPVVWSGEDFGEFTIATDVQGDQDEAIGRVAAACGLKVERRDVEVKTLRVAKRQ